MKKRYYGKGLVLNASDLNTASDYQEDNVQNFVLDIAGQGRYVEGVVTADSPVSWNVVVPAGSVFYTDQGNRIYIENALDVDLEPSVDPGAGNELYISAFIAHTYTQSESVQDEDGSTVYKDNVDSYTITVTESSVQAANNAVKPSIPANSLCLCDVLISKTVYDQGNITSGDIDHTRNTSADLNISDITDDLEISGSLTVNTDEGDNDVIIKKNGGGNAYQYDAGNDTHDFDSVIDSTSNLIIGGSAIFNDNLDDNDFIIKKADTSDDMAYHYDAGNDTHNYYGEIRTTGTPVDGNSVPNRDYNDDRYRPIDSLGLGANAIVNGDMKIAQRGTSFLNIATGNFLTDRWGYNKSGSMIHSASQDSSAPPNEDFNYSLKINCTTIDSSIGATEFCFVSQVVEGYNYRPFKNKTANLSFWVNATKTGTYCVSFRNGDVSRSFVSEYTVNSSNTWEFITIPVVFDYVGTDNFTNGRGLNIDFILACGANFQTTADTWQSGNYIATSNQVNACDSTDNNFYLTGVQLNMGSEALPFCHRHYGHELELCQRYYLRINADDVYSYFASGCEISTTSAKCIVHLPVTMISPPDFDKSDADDFVIYDGSSLSLTTLSSEFQTNNTVSLALGFASGGTAGNGCVLMAENTTDAWIDFDAEL